MLGFFFFNCCIPILRTLSGIKNTLNKYLLNNLKKNTFRNDFKEFSKKKIELNMLYPIKPSLKYEGIIKIFSGTEVLKD